MARLRYTLSVAAALALVVATPAAASAHGADSSTAAAVEESESPPTTPKAKCGPGSLPETDLQGRVPAADYDSGRVKQGYRCNATMVGSFLPSSPEQSEGGLKVERYVDAAGHECAYYDSTQIFPTNAFNEHGVGVYVLDMANPEKPVQTAALTTPAMLSPHESLVLSQKRGLLVAVAGTLGTAPGIVDVYDVTKDCRHPELQSSTPIGVLGHESGFSPDGRTFYAASFASETIVAVDLDDPRLPKVLWAGNIGTHGLSISDDGNRAYLASLDLGDTAAFLGSPFGNLDGPGLVILDTSDIQARRANPQVRPIGALTWPSVSTPQNAIPITIAGRPYVLEIDEFGAGRRVGAGRIIDVSNERKPFVVSNLRLEVHQQENFDRIAGDPGATPFGYSAHYCNVPRRDDPGIVACGMISSGLRVFDIRNPQHPREVAYFNAPVTGGSQGYPQVMASPTFVPERREIWYVDANSGFYAVRLTNGAWPAAGRRTQPRADAAVGGGAAPPPPGAALVSVPAAGTLADTGAGLPALLGTGFFLLALTLRVGRGRARLTPHRSERGRSSPAAPVRRSVPT